MRTIKREGHHDAPFPCEILCRFALDACPWDTPISAGGAVFEARPIVFQVGTF